MAAQHYYLYSSTGNTLGIQEYIGYFEIDEDGYCSRYLEIKSDGTAVRYTQDKAADHLGQLPEGSWSEYEAETKKAEYGVTTPITAGLFDSVWANTGCAN